MIGYITGTWFYDYAWLEKKKISTTYWDAEVLVWKIGGKDVAIICRHGEWHENLPHNINHRANIQAFKDLWVKAVVSFSVVWVMNKEYELGKTILPKELYFPDNRLWNWEVCTFFTQAWEPWRWHLIASSFYNSQITKDIIDIVEEKNCIENATYIHAVWPRFNSKAEIRSFRNFGWDIISQTCWPEAILCGELEIPFGNVCFWVDYANWLFEENTSIEELQKNIAKSSEIFERVITELLKKDSTYKFEGFVYRFD
jgi:5'-methylthioadenosine phosphorylase